MEINRNQYFLAGLVMLLLGLQVRAVETFVLNDRASRFIAERITPVMGESDSEGNTFAAAAPRPAAPCIRRTGSAMP